MPSSYTTSLRLTLPATGELSGQWGNTVNTGITELLDAAVAGTASISTWGGAGVAYTLSNNSGTADEARKMFIVATGSPGEAKNVICPAVSKFYVFRNDTTGGYALTLKTSGGTGIAVPAGQYKFLYCDGTNVVEMFNSAGALTLSGALSVGGTATFAANPTLSAGTANQVQYLNGSKVLSGSANLTFDGTTLTANALTLTNNPTLSGGTANGVLYLNASKVATSGSGVTYDGTILRVNGSASSGLRVTSNSGAANGFNIYNDSSTDIAYLMNFYNGSMVFGVSNAEQMRLTSTGLGIGTSSPGYKLDVAGTGDLANRVSTTGTSNAASIILQSGSGTTSGLFAYARFLNNDTNAQDWRIGTYGTNNLSIVNAKANTVPVTVDTSGNLGLGVTPSAWGSDTTALQLGGSTFSAFAAASRFLGLANARWDGTNWRYLGNAFATQYRGSGGTGTHEWYTAPSGTAGNAISFTQAMTLDASGNLGVGTTSPGTRLDLSDSVGRVMLNGSQISWNRNPNSGTIPDTAKGSALIISDVTGGGVIQFWTSSGVNASGLAERARITSGGNLLVGTQSESLSNSGSFIFSPGTSAFGGALSINHSTSNNNGSGYINFAYNGAAIGSITQNGTTAVAYNTSSDYRLKDNPQPLTNSGAFIDALQPKTWNWKADGSRGVGFIAHEAQAVSPSSVVGEKDAVDADGKPVMQAMEYGSAEFIANIIAELQSLRARVQALEAQP